MKACLRLNATVLASLTAAVSLTASAASTCPRALATAKADKSGPALSRAAFIGCVTDAACTGGGVSCGWTFTAGGEGVPTSRGTAFKRTFLVKKDGSLISPFSVRAPAGATLSVRGCYGAQTTTLDAAVVVRNDGGKRSNALCLSGTVSRTSKRVALSGGRSATQQRKLALPKAGAKTFLERYKRLAKTAWAKYGTKKTWESMVARIKSNWTAAKSRASKMRSTYANKTRQWLSNTGPTAAEETPAASASRQPDEMASASEALQITQPPASAPVATSAAAPLGVIYPFHGYRQCTGEWKDHMLGNSSTSICTAGCAATSFAMLMQFYGLDLTPDRFVDKLTLVGGFTGTSASIASWSAVGGLVDRQVNDSWEGDRSTDAGWEANWEKNAKKALQLVLENFTGASPRPMVAQVDYNEDSGHKGDHFVLIAGVDKNGEPILFDPGARSTEPVPGAISQMKRKGGFAILRVLWLESK